MHSNCLSPQPTSSSFPWARGATALSARYSSDHCRSAQSETLRRARRITSDLLEMTIEHRTLTNDKACSLFTVPCSLSHVQLPSFEPQAYHLLQGDGGYPAPDR